MLFSVCNILVKIQLTAPLLNLFILSIISVISVSYLQFRNIEFYLFIILFDCIKESILINYVFLPVNRQLNQKICWIFGHFLFICQLLKLYFAGLLFLPTFFMAITFFYLSSVIISFVFFQNLFSLSIIVMVSFKLYVLWI